MQSNFFIPIYNLFAHDAPYYKYAKFINVLFCAIIHKSIFLVSYSKEIR